MQNISKLNIARQKHQTFDELKKFIFKFSSFFESLLILGLWVFIFYNSENFGSYTKEAFITYLLTGNIIGFISSFFLQRFIRNDIKQREQNLLTNYPFRYLKIILLRGFGRNFFPFLIAICLNVILLKIMAPGLILNFEPIYLLLLVIIVSLAFIFEFLLAYLIRLLTFWIMASGEIYVIIRRFEKLMAGNYFPLGLISIAFLNISYFFPFAYTFYVPTQLYLKVISPYIAIRGIFIQIFWIWLLFFAIRYIVKRKMRKMEIMANNS